MITIALEDTYLGTKLPQHCKKSIFMKEMYYDKETRVMVNWSVNEFYTKFLLKIDAFP